MECLHWGQLISHEVQFHLFDSETYPKWTNHIEISRKILELLGLASWLILKIESLNLGRSTEIPGIALEKASGPRTLCFQGKIMSMCCAAMRNAFPRVKIMMVPVMQNVHANPELD